MKKKKSSPEAIVKVLKQAEKHLKKGELWTQGWLAKDNKDLPCRFDNRLACRWDLSGAVLVTAGDTPLAKDTLHELEATVKELGKWEYLTNFNDDEKTRYKDVRHVISRTIHRVSAA